MKTLITGSVAYDYLMTFPGHFSAHILPDQLNEISLSFLVDSMVKRRGGIAPNIAYTMALLGEHPMVMATVGEDFGEYREWLERKGVDTRFMVVVPGVFTASFFANTDLENNQISSFYPGAMSFASELSIYELDPKPDLVIISPNDPSAMDKAIQESVELGIPYLYDPSQQIVRLDSETLRYGIERAEFLFANQYEFGLIENKTDLSIEDVLKRVKILVMTRGKEGAWIYTRDQIYKIPAIPPEKIMDPTGVGDAFRGGFLVGFVHGLDFDVCGRMGALASTYCLEHRGTQDHTFTPKEFISRYRQHFDDHGALDVLLNAPDTTVNNPAIQPIGEEK